MDASRADTGAGPPQGAGSFGLWVLLASLSVLFLASLVSVWWLHDDPALWPDGLPSLPIGLWLSTALLAALSWTMHRERIRAAFVLSLLFLAAQTWNWVAMLADLPVGVKSLYAFHFYALTFLHAAHVLGGVGWHAVVLARPRAAAHRLRAVYWDFLGVAWLLLVADLLLVRVPHEFGSLPSLGSLALLGAATAVSGAYWLQALRLLWRRGERAFTVFGTFFPPFAYLQVWGRAEELGSERLAWRWGLAQGIWLVVLVFAGAVHAAWMQGLAT